MAEEDFLNSPLRIVFFGTPEFAVASLQKLLQSEGTEILAVYTQPDRPVGRGRRMQPPAVKAAAEAAGLDIRQPENLGDGRVVEEISALCPDLLVVVAFGAILPAKILQSARFGAFNLHASLLPRYRGAAPIQRAIQNGEKVTGATVMQMDAGMDTGHILLQKALAIGLDDTAETIHDQLAGMGGDLLLTACRRLREGSLVAVPQDPDLASYAPKLHKNDGRIDWNRSANEVHDHIRAMHPWPGAFFDWTAGSTPKSLRLQVFPGRLGPEKERQVRPGDLDFNAQTEQLRIACQDRYYLISKLKPASGKPMSAAAFRCGYLDVCQQKEDGPPLAKGSRTEAKNGQP